MARPQITIEERSYAIALLRHGKTKGEVAAILRLHRNTISAYTTDSDVAMFTEWNPPALDDLLHRVRGMLAQKAQQKTATV